MNLDDLKNGKRVIGIVDARTVTLGEQAGDVVRAAIEFRVIPLVSDEVQVEHQTLVLTLDRNQLLFLAETANSMAAQLPDYEPPAPTALQ